MSNKFYKKRCIVAIDPA